MCVLNGIQDELAGERTCLVFFQSVSQNEHLAPFKKRTPITMLSCYPAAVGKSLSDFIDRHRTVPRSGARRGGAT